MSTPSVAATELGRQRPGRGGWFAGAWQSVVARVIVRRLLIAVPLIFAVSALSFVLASLTPGDAAQAILGADAPPRAYEQLKHQLGLDLPLYEQYWRWLSNALHGDLGSSVLTNESVSHALNSRLAVTLQLIVGALLISIFVGIPLGILSAVRGGVVARLADAIALLGFAVPAFWLAAQLISVFAVKLHWFPPTGYVSFGDAPGQWVRSLALPVVALGLAGIAAMAKQTRDAMLDALGSEYIRMARANGIRRRSIVFRYALKNAALPVLTILGLQAVWLLGGTVFVENVFGLPGMGSLAVNATLRHDLPVVQGIVVYFTVMVVAVNLIVDIAYTYFNPRVRAW